MEKIKLVNRTPHEILMQSRQNANTHMMAVNHASNYHRVMQLQKIIDSSKFHEDINNMLRAQIRAGNTLVQKQMMRTAVEKF